MFFVTHDISCKECKGINAQCHISCPVLDAEVILENQDQILQKYGLETKCTYSHTVPRPEIKMRFSGAQCRRRIAMLLAPPN